MSHLRNSVQVRVPHLAAAAGLALMLAGTAAFAQDDAKTAAAPAAPAAGAAPVSPWIKQCGQDQQTKKPICVTGQVLRAETNQMVSTLQFRKQDGDPKVVVAATVLTGVQIIPGILLQVDQNKPTQLKYVGCDQQVCVAQGEVDDAYMTAMKKGTKVQVISLNPQGKPLVFPYPLTGFKKIVEGPGLDPAATKARMDQLQQRLQQSADQNRQKLIDQQNKELGTTPATGQ